MIWAVLFVGMTIYGHHKVVVGGRVTLEMARHAVLMLRAITWTLFVLAVVEALR